MNRLDQEKKKGSTHSMVHSELTPMIRTNYAHNRTMLWFDPFCLVGHRRASIAGASAVVRSGGKLYEHGGEDAASKFVSPEASV
jgi:hypothetical protein